MDIRSAIEEVLPSAKDVMSFLGDCAVRQGEQNQALSWTTPTGLPCAGRYYEPLTKRVERRLSGARVQRKLADGYTPIINLPRARRGAAANFVHSLDASHLIMTANACVEKNINDLAFVHDSFGCLAPYATRVRKIIRKQFVRLYEENDPLKELREQIVTEGKVLAPDLPSYGNLKLRGMLSDDNYAVH